jgi:hypothetical protein
MPIGAHRYSLFVLVAFGSPARFALKKIQIAARDAEVAKPLDQRSPLPDGPGLIAIAALSGFALKRA